MKGTRRRILAAAVIVLVVGGAAAIFLGDYFGPVKSNIRRLGNPDQQVQKQAIDALVQMGQSAVPALAEALQDKEPGVRRSAAEALGWIGPKAQDAVPALVEALQDKELVRQGAMEALGQIGPAAQAAVPALAEALQDKEPFVRQRAGGLVADSRPLVLEKLDEGGYGG